MFRFGRTASVFLAVLLFGTLWSPALANKWVDLEFDKHLTMHAMTAGSDTTDVDYSFEPFDATRFYLKLGWLYPFRYVFSYENSDFLALKERQEEEGRVRSLFTRMKNELGFEGIWLIWHQDTFRATATDSDNQRYNFIYDRQRYGIKFQVDKETQREIFRHILDADFDESLPVMLTQILMAPSLLFIEAFPDDYKGYMMLAVETASYPQPFSFRYDWTINPVSGGSPINFNGTLEGIDYNFSTTRILFRTGHDINLLGFEDEAQPLGIRLSMNLGGGLSLYEPSDDIKVQTETGDGITPSGGIAPNFSASFGVGLSLFDLLFCHYSFDYMFEGVSNQEFDSFAGVTTYDYFSYYRSEVTQKVIVELRYEF